MSVWYPVREGVGHGDDLLVSSNRGEFDRDSVVFGSGGAWSAERGGIVAGTCSLDELSRRRRRGPRRLSSAIRSGHAKAALIAMAVWFCPCVASAQAKPAPSASASPLPPPRPAELLPRAPVERNVVKPPQPEQPAPAEPTPSSASTCLSRLAAIPGNRIEPAVSELAQADAACRVEEPVRLHALALRGNKAALTVTFDPAPLVSCAMASAVADWLDTSVQPLAQGHFAMGLTGLRVGGGQECRRRNRASAGPISEHATGQALDIFAFKLAEGGKSEVISVEKPSGLAQNRFLDGVRQSACGAFMTALGPGSDAAHANHLHVDIQARRSRASRFCQ